VGRRVVEKRIFRDKMIFKVWTDGDAVGDGGGGR